MMQIIQEYNAKRRWDINVCEQDGQKKKIREMEGKDETCIMLYWLGLICTNLIPFFYCASVNKETGNAFQGCQLIARKREIW